MSGEYEAKAAYQTEMTLAREQAKLADDAGLPQFDGAGNTSDPAQEHRLNARLHLEIAREIRQGVENGMNLG